MGYADTCDALSEAVRAEEYSETGALMIMTFIEALDEGETYKMALSLAKSSPQRADAEG